MHRYLQVRTKSQLIGWVDTPQGRYMTVLSTGTDPTLSLAPADATRLAAGLAGERARRTR